MFGRILTAGHGLVSIAVQIWAMITIPLAVVSAVHDLTHARGILFGLSKEWSGLLRTQLPWPSHLPDWAMSLSYIAILCAGLAWLYWTSVVLVSKSYYAAALHGDLGPVAPQMTGPSGAESAVAGVGILAILGGTLAGQSAAAAGLALMGPVGISIVVIAGGWAILVGVSKSEEARNEAIKDQARQATEELVRKREALAAEAVEQYKSQEIRRLKMSGVVVLALVAINFAAPLILPLFAGR
ncbi:MAG: hypothetical protein WDN01_19995 [Rhizomicrobium sp.]